MFGRSSAEESQPLMTRIPTLNRWRLGCFLLLVSQFFERMGYYGLTVNFIFFLNGDPFAWATYNAVALMFAFNTVSYFFAVVGAWLADAHVGKFAVMVIGYMFYLLFYLPIPFLYFDTWDGAYQRQVPSYCLVQRPLGNSSHWKPGSRGFPAWFKSNDRWFWQERCSVVVSFAMTLVAIGAAFIKSVITPFGADQVQRVSPEAMRSFFNWYYWIINAGTFFAHLALAYVQVNVSMFWGYLAAYSMIVLSFLLLLIARPFLQRTGAQGSCAGEIVGVLASSAAVACCRKKRRRRPDGDLFSDCTVQENDARRVLPKCLDLSKRSRGGKYDAKVVEDVKTFLHIFLVFVCFIFYWASYFQIQTSFLSQGLHMKVSFFSDTTSVPVAWLSLFDVVVIVLLIPFLDSVVYPALTRCGLSPRLYSRMLVGMALSTGAMCVAGYLERIRMVTFWGADNASPFSPSGSVNQTIGDTVYFAANISIFYQIPQYALLGVGEAFTNVAGLEFAYMMAPFRMQSLVTGCYWLFAGLGSMLGVLLVQSLQGSLLFSSDWFDINYREPCRGSPDRYCAETRLDVYFFILAALQVLGMLLFVLVVICVLPRCVGRPATEGRREEEEEEAVLVVSGDSLLESMESVPVQRVIHTAPPLR